MVHKNLQTLTKAAREKRESPAPAVARETRMHTGFRVHPSLLDRADIAARRLGLTRSAFISLSIAEKVERMDA